MSGNLPRRIEAGADLSAALILALAAAHAVAAIAGDAAVAVVTGAIAFSSCLALLGSVGAGQGCCFALPGFALRPFEPGACVELVLGESGMLPPVGPESRVVRLFEPAGMQPMGRPNAEADEQSEFGTSPTAPPDASQALYEALAELRRSLS